MFKSYLLPLLAIALIAFSGCEDDTFDPVLSLNGGPQITAPAAGGAFIFADTTLGNEFATFQWTAADFGFDAGVTYRLQAALAGTGFADVADIGPATSDREITVTNQMINSFLINQGAVGGTAEDIEFRVRARVSDEVDPQFSAPVQFTVTPFEVAIVYPSLRVPGAYQGWNPMAAESDIELLYSVQDNGRYEGYVYFPVADEFKITNGASWDVNYGTSATDGVLEANGGNLSVAAPGVYRFQVNINDLSYTISKTDWGLIGNATPTGWDADSDLTYDPATGTYSITVDLVEGELKFRANDGWDVNFGDTGVDGKLEYNGDNIAVTEAGNYTILLKLDGAIYTYELIKN